jgi:hypothetical protein
MLFKNSVRTSKRTPHFTITEINWLMLFKDIIAVYVNPLKPKLVQIIFKNPVRTSKRTLHFTITKVNWLTLFKEITPVYETHTYKTQRYWLLHPVDFKRLRYRHPLTASYHVPGSTATLAPSTDFSAGVGLRYRDPGQSVGSSYPTSCCHKVSHVGLRLRPQIRKNTVQNFLINYSCAFYTLLVLMSHSSHSPLHTVIF